MPNDLLTLDQVGQFATLVFLCWSLTQFAKRPVDALLRRVGVAVPTQYVALVVAGLLYLVAAAVNGPVTWQTLFLALVNGVVISMTAAKAHESAAQDGKEQPPPAA